MTILEGGEVEGAALRIGQPQHADEVSRHELGVRHLARLDGAQAPGRVEAVHQHDGPARPVSAHREAERRGVIQRPRAQVDRIRPEPEDQAHHQVQRHPRAERGKLGRPHDPLRPPGRARGVEDRAPLDLGPVAGPGLDRLGRQARDRRLVARHAGQVRAVAAGHEHPHARHPGGHLRRLGRGEQDGRARVGDDVGRLVGRQVPVDRRPVGAGPLRAPRDLEVLGPVGQHDRHVTGGPHAEAGEQPGDLAAAGLQLPVGHQPAAVGHDHGGLARRHVGDDGRALRRFRRGRGGGRLLASELHLISLAQLRIPKGVTQGT